MKKMPSLFFVLAVLATAHAQTQPSATSSRWSIDVMAGPSLPVGKFTTQHLYGAGLYNQNQTGFDVGVVLDYRLNSAFGLCLAVDGQENPVANYGDVLSGPESFHYYVYPWKMARWMTGAHIDLPLAARKRLMLQIRALAGVLKVYTPAYDRTLAGDTEAEHISGSSVPLAFGYQADMGLKWRISRQNYALLDVAYAGGDAAIHYHVTNPAIGVPSDIRSPIPTGSLQVRIGAQIGL